MLYEVITHKLQLSSFFIFSGIKGAAKRPTAIPIISEASYNFV